MCRRRGTRSGAEPPSFPSSSGTRFLLNIERRRCNFNPEIRVSALERRRGVTSRRKQLAASDWSFPRSRSRCLLCVNERVESTVVVDSLFFKHKLLKPVSRVKSLQNNIPTVNTQTDDIAATFAHVGCHGDGRLCGPGLAQNHDAVIRQ